MSKTTIYTESKELREVAESLKARYSNVVGYIDINKIFFAFKGGDLPNDFEVSGIKNDWVKHTINSLEEPKMYCISLSYDFYQKANGPLLEWIMLDLLYCCDPKLDGKLRRRDVHEFSRILNTLDDLGHSTKWRDNFHLPPLLGEETIIFGFEEDEPI